MRADARARVRQALDELRPYLSSYVAQALDGAARARRPARSDTAALLAAMVENWDVAFASRLPNVVRSYVFELRDVRNRWAHEEPFTDDEARRAEDTATLIARAIGAPPLVTGRASAPAGAGADPAAPSSHAPSSGSIARARDRSAPARQHELAAPRVTQREVMRAIWTRCAPDEDRAIQEYAAAERRGEAPRARNTSGHSPEQYAKALLADGLKKGWLSHHT